VALAQSVAALLMVLVGGVGTLVGSFVGSVAIISLENFVSFHTERWPLVLGLVFIVTMIFAPEGLVGRARLILARQTPQVRKP
jgi:branched-chain amino acid transport system permease protein